MLASGDENTEGLNKVTGIEGFKDLYANPYAVPAAFVISNGSYESQSTVPAEYLNDICRHLSGVEKDIFIKVMPESESADQNTYHYSFTIDNDRAYILYANFVTNTDTGAKLYINGEEYTSYSMEMAPSMVRIKTINGKAEAELVFNEDQSGTAVTDAQFYLLDLETLEEATNAIKAKAASKSSISNGHCVFEIDNAKQGESLFTSIPYNAGWTVTRNGQKTDFDLTGDTFITVPLENGSNVIEMTYQVPHKTAGILATAAGLVMLAGIAFIENRKRKSQ